MMERGQPLANARSGQSSSAGKRNPGWKRENQPGQDVSLSRDWNPWNSKQDVGLDLALLRLETCPSLQPHTLSKSRPDEPSKKDSSGSRYTRMSTFPGEPGAAGDREPREPGGEENQRKYHRGRGNRETKQRQQRGKE